MRARVDPDSLGFLVADISRMLRAELERRAGQAGLGITAGELRTLSHAARAGSVRQNVLADRMGLEPMTLSAYADRLEGRGLISRTTDPADRRAKLIELTPAAQSVLAATQAIAAGIVGDAARSVHADDWKVAMDTLKAVRAGLSGLRSGRDDAA